MADRTVIRRIVVSAAIVLLTALPAAAQHRARLSADLADSLPAGSPSIDVIVHGDKASVDAAAQRHGLKVKKYLKSGAVLHVTAGQLAELQQDDAYDHLSSDIPIHSSDVTTETIEANEVWAGGWAISGARRAERGRRRDRFGRGLQPRRAQGQNRRVGGLHRRQRRGHLRPRHACRGHDRRPGGREYGDYRGVASGARIINLRVLGADGSGMSSNVIEAIDWAIENRARYNIRVINLSLGAPVLQPYRDDPLCEATERAVSAGIVVVAAAGNFGHTKDGRTIMGGITSPGNDPNVLTVGALDPHATSDRSDDTVATYSSRGPTMYDLVMKPDLVAPGSHVVSAEAAGSYLVTTYPQIHVTGTGANAYTQLSGTSMAAAVASGAVALLVQERPSLTPNDAKVALQMSSTLMPSAGLLASGAGSLDAFVAAEFVNGDYSRAIAESLGGDLALPAANFGHHDRCPHATHRQHAEARPSLLTGARRITFGTTTFRGQSITWGKTVVGGKTFVWGHGGVRGRRARARRVVLGQDDTDSIVWGSRRHRLHRLGQRRHRLHRLGPATTPTPSSGVNDDSDSIIWGNDDSDSIVWGNDDSDSIVWGNDDSDSIVWGNDDNDSIVWGNDDNDSIVWGNGGAPGVA